MEVDKIKAGIRTRFEEVLKDIWQKNGDLCSVIYTGTGSLDGKSKVNMTFTVTINYLSFI